MIVFTKIRWKNFLSYGNVWSEIELDSTKNTLLMGQNGAGKSTLLDALCFALFGKAFRKVNKGGVVNSINNKQCRVEIEFTIGPKNYKVVRGIKPNVFEICCNNVLVNQDASVNDYQNYLEDKILGMTYKTFTQIVILGSASYTPFMSLSAPDRRGVIENLLDIQIFSSMATIVSNKLKDNKAALEQNRIKLVSKEENKTYIEKTIANLKAKSEEKLEEMKRSQATYLEWRNKWNATMIDRQEELDELLENITDHSELRHKHTNLITLKSKIEANIHRLDQENQFLTENDTCPTCQQTITSGWREYRIDINTNKAVEMMRGLDKLNNQVGDIIQTLNNVESTLKEITRAKQAVTQAKTSYESFKRCYDEVTQEIKDFALSDTALRDSEEELRTVLLEISSLQEEKASLLEERQYIDVATTLLKDGGIKTKVIKHYLPLINKQINKYLSELGFFVSFNLDENFEETIKSRHRDEFVYQNFSEGEKLRIDLAILLTWRMVARTKNSVNCNLLIFDEIFDRAMDANGVDEFIRIMWDLGRQGSNVFVISHRDTMADKFQRSIQFSKEKNFSVMKKDE